MIKLAIFLSVAVGTFCENSLFGTDQSSAVKGRLICDKQPEVGAIVKLIDEDDFGIDDVLDDIRTNSNGEFTLSGHTKEFTPIDPKLVIYHDCHDQLPCQRMLTIKIKDKYITQGKEPDSVFDAGVIQLAGKFPGEGRGCGTLST